MSVEVQELPCHEGHIGLLTLASPATLNALTEEMITAIRDSLERWAVDERICVVVIRGAGEKSFCAGGDIRALYQSLTGAGNPEAAFSVFRHEYALDYTLHRFPKPVVGIGHGIIMGGGLGLFSACRYRLLTPDATLAMPEISIGLFPDVGSSWFLNRLPGRLGLFMGLTGCRLNITDSLRVGLADMALPTNDQQGLLSRLQEERWSGHRASDDSRLLRLLQQLELQDYRALPAGQLELHERNIAKLCAGVSLQEIVDQLLAARVDSEWWQACMKTLEGGCPVSALLIWNQLKKAQQMSLKDVFRMELAMVWECVRRPDLTEGIRARLIDRDQNPTWSFARIEDVPDEIIEAHFLPVWNDQTDPMQLE
ncbi:MULTISPECIES: enoyl-CoA hydratase/isomerase family protein [unclassified Marinobacter]|uniref:enoyl-CoA hydratase/isomerase family protein n=1 Tax=unclassified Marinobacter TaxID=83889 RepID=UPI0026E2D118|nr:MULTISPECIES: enoyl-CoA hydratase/isomerase family protein [unclassified Marinobacter]MDO6441525.1 enoyl-CoA hydratase/isomerase family protein [Marinobacter sp. 2_MG-2023]MDO6822312.1 enoyl-CoA hydratase/isomerase family protein [Marinobacter sp. 1_MG-2023]